MRWRKYQHYWRRADGKYFICRSPCPIRHADVYLAWYGSTSISERARDSFESAVADCTAHIQQTLKG
jgi:hypothetical protein